MGFIAETKRIGLLVMETRHAEEAMRFWGDPQVMAGSGGASKPENLPKIIQAYQRCYVATGLTVFGVVEKETGKIIGAAGFNVAGNAEKIELIYHFSTSSWGKGYATEAAELCLKLAENHPDVSIVYASADPVNQGSLKVLDKLGFQYIDHRWFDDTQQEEPYYELHIGQGTLQG